VQLTDLKAHDKRNLMERFFSDPRVVRILAQVIKNQPIENETKPQKNLSNFGLIKQAQSLRSDLNRKDNA
jgi:hypothetical protein